MMMKAYLYDSNGRKVGTATVGETILDTPPDLTYVEYVSEDGQRYRAPVAGDVVLLDESELLAIDETS